VVGAIAVHFLDAKFLKKFLPVMVLLMIVFIIYGSVNYYAALAMGVMVGGYFFRPCERSEAVSLEGRTNLLAGKQIASLCSQRRRNRLLF
jgi:hypothetical protein